MSNQNAGAGAGAGAGYDKDKDKERTVAKTAGLVVFSGIAMSILKAINPFNNPNLINHNNNETKPLTESTQPLQPSQSLAPQEPIIKKPITCTDLNLPESSPRTIEIVRGDTLWDLSKKYGVSIEAIKEANGLTGDTIYAGKKLTIP
uniref:LysM domain-containing protein n=1 Tax=Davidia involucrata TaxID=16924 RepID=A0A5B7BPK2_DAVIN